ncbi:uncharacterized protein Tco025E_06248 [Trypanosoma conorhini]|uniref:G protein-coupled receptor n=1 Tax=Trypanosoma conorhini TaxID=83891 RepID=A0A3R7RUI2_9TRYP|nr:uncharacterized protein Tco025E_06248 [Trypanosoma conorhini]RNF13267.1 hypothetical protein Tco025E_06248 [Trypanosoma conorhini]
MRGGASLFFAVVACSLLLCPPVATLDAFTQREFEFELWPMPRFSDGSVRCGLQKQWFILNEDNRPFSMTREGEIKLEVRTLSFDVNALGAYANRLMYARKLGEASPETTCLLFTQPRIFRVMQQITVASAVGAVPLAADFGMVPEYFLDDAFMAMDTVLVFKVFAYRDWQRLMKQMKMQPEKRFSNSENLFTTSPDVPLDDVLLRMERVCSAPALLTKHIDTASAYHTTVDSIQLQPQTHVVAVLMQCSHTPVKVRVFFQMSNINGRGSAEYISTENVYLLFLTAYVVLFTIMLFLIIPCGYSCRTLSATSSVGGDGENRTAARRGSPNGGIFNGRGNVLATVGGTDGASIYRQSEDDRLNAVNLDRAWETGAGVENSTSAVAPSSSPRRCSKGCCRAFWSKVRHVFRQYLLILYPPLQWIVLLSLIIRGTFCLMKLIRYRTIVEHPEEPQGCLGILAVLLDVGSRTTVFVMQQLVCIGWGCAYRRPPTIKIVTAALASVITFFAYVFNGTCSSNGLPAIYTTYDGDREYTSFRCMTIRTIVLACELLGWTLNLFQLTTLMATIGRAATTTGPSRRGLGLLGEKTALYLRYRSMCVPYALGMLLPQVLFVIFSNTLMGIDDHYVEIALREFSQWYALAFVLLFLRKEPFYL